MPWNCEKHTISRVIPLTVYKQPQLSQFIRLWREPIRLRIVNYIQVQSNKLHMDITSTMSSLPILHTMNSGRLYNTIWG